MCKIKSKVPYFYSPALLFPSISIPHGATTVNSLLCTLLNAFILWLLFFFPSILLTYSLLFLLFSCSDSSSLFTLLICWLVWETWQAYMLELCVNSDKITSEQRPHISLTKEHKFHWLPFLFCISTASRPVKTAPWNSQSQIVGKITFK